VTNLDPLLTSSYNFSLPDNLIATHPVTPRNSAKLLVYNRHTDTIIHTYFYNLAHFIPKECALIFNDTKVIKARLYGHKQSGGSIELLINKPINAHLVNVYIKGRVKADTLLRFQNNIFAKVVSLNNDGSRDIVFLQQNKQIRFEKLLSILDEIGHIPLPPYLQREDTKQDKEDYQSVFALHDGAVAAPTASLHFTSKQHKEICQTFKHAYITLHVGAGTFKPVQTDLITQHPMHGEYYKISDQALELINSGTPILSVGTTTTRTIEYFTRNTYKVAGEANLFLHPGNTPKRVNHLLTNFHLPKSTLLMLVASFVGLEKALQLYDEAIKNNYRFYSYGDAMLIL